MFVIELDTIILIFGQKKKKKKQTHDAYQFLIFGRIFSF